MAPQSVDEAQGEADQGADSDFQVLAEAEVEGCGDKASGICFLELSRKHLDAKRVAVCQLLCDFYNLIHAQGMFLDEPAKERLPLIGRRMCGMFAALSREAFAKGQKGWKMTPKVHLTLHLCEWQATTYGNPRVSWTYSDEDLVGTMVEVTQSCHNSTVVPTAMVKWLVVAFGHE